MIIRMTVEDNDFTEMLESFADNLQEFFYLETKTALKDNYSPEIVRTLIETEDAIRNTMWATSMKEVTDESKTLLKARLHIMWGKYIDSIEKEEIVKEYLKRNFKCSFSFNFKDKWENDEAVYYFTHAKKWISQ